MIAFLALRPLRLRNFTALTLGDSLQRQGNCWWIVLAAEDTKNRRPLELPFPDPLVPALEHYLAQVRPWLLGSPGPPGRLDRGSVVDLPARHPDEPGQHLRADHAPHEGRFR